MLYQNRFFFLLDSHIDRLHFSAFPIALNKFVHEIYCLCIQREKNEPTYFVFVKKRRILSVEDPWYFLCKEPWYSV